MRATEVVAGADTESVERVITVWEAYFKLVESLV
jgi:hypothetical protein